MTTENNQPTDDADSSESAVGSMTPEAMRVASQAATDSARGSTVGVAGGGAERSRPRENTLLHVDNLKMYFPVTAGIIFQRKVADIKAVDGITFDVKEGETLGLVGESGCGKSTTGRAILQLYRPTAGEVVMFDPKYASASDTPEVSADALVAGSDSPGVDLTKLKGGKLRAYRRRMQMIFQDPYASLNPRMSVGSIVGEPMAIHNLHKGRRKERVRELLETVGLNPYFASRYPHEFSGGQRQRIASPAHSPSSPPSSSPTNPSPPSMSPSRPRSSTSWRTSSATSVSPTYSSPTTSPSSATSVTASPSCTSARSLN